MNKKILAISMCTVLFAAFLIPASFNAQAATRSENKSLKIVLDLTTSIKGLISGRIQPTLTTILDDLQLEQKFWQFEPFQVSGEIVIGIFGFCPGEVFVRNPSACAYSVESIQIQGVGEVKAISVDGIVTEIKPEAAPINLLIDTGLGNIGASVVVAVGAPTTPISGEIEFNGEKPQGMQLIRFVSPSNNFGRPTCLDAQGRSTDCPADKPGWDKVMQTIEKIESM